jgi:hypothetical protein
VRYKPAIPVIIVVIGAVNLVLGLLLVQSGGDANPSLFLGPVLALLGILQLTRPYFEFDTRSGTIGVKALIGSMTRRFGGSEGGRLFVDGNRILVTKADGRTKKVPVSQFFAREEEWQAVVGRIRQATGAAPGAS